MPLFRSDPAKDAEKEAAKAATGAEATRLMALPLEDLAAASLVAFGPDGARAGQHGLASLMVANWLLSGFPSGTGYLKELHPRVQAAMQRLEVAGLILRKSVGSPRLSITEAGMQALQEGTAVDYLSGRRLA